ncbi:hypothetical protein [Amycolatopsis sp. PS_44_ISF1]|uniref:hypothetical protein n=1 Tax=Amycolatopsis sp. PS_44_ISF1 TaxID=2974917 RepID=UPI0028DF038C|nr:hypothetical protein [Amycolatopsis sp. PS_44_ISF1]MDT8913680.1 hypothetical protein [Amycolatopsis sp. PS_44_ISF1]
MDRRHLLALTVAAIAAAASFTAPPASAAAAVTSTFYAAPAGSGSDCTPAAPCSLTGAQAATRNWVASHPGADVTVLLADGTFRPSRTWTFTAADSGSPGHPVVWTAAPGAHPVIDGASQITGWTEADAGGVWSAPVPAGSATRQLWVDGRKAPVAQATPGDLGFTGAWTGSSQGYALASDATAAAWFATLSPAQVAGVEFDYPAGNGPWTESHCRVAGYDASTKLLTMTQPCWNNVTARARFRQGSGALPSMPINTKPASVRNARDLLGPGQWFLDGAGNTLYYRPLPGQQMSTAEVDLPRLESLLRGSGTLAAPLHDLTFSGLQFSHATWNAPSGPAGFSDVQSNLTMTTSNNQGLCTFSTPAGSCPWGALTQPLANVAFSATRAITLSGNRFTHLGGAGLSLMYGAVNTLVQGNEFTDISSTAMLLGCTHDPLPTDPAQAPGIKQYCTPDPAAVSADTVGANEILTGTTVTDNVVHAVGTDYSSACGITLLFSRGTTITHNDLYDLPYTGITAGVIQGHVDQAATPQNSTNINAGNTISQNLIHDYLTVRHDGGAIYVEGHQATYVYQADGVTIDPARTMANGLQATGNVAYNSHVTNFTYYDDAGAEWITWQGNVAFSAGESAQGGCSPTGHLRTIGNYFSARWEYYPCNPPVDSSANNNTTISATPGPDTVPAGVLSAAGVRPEYRYLTAAAGSRIAYSSPAVTATTVLVGGNGFSAGTPVYVKGVRATGVQYMSGGFLTVPVAAGTTATDLTIGVPATMINPGDGVTGVSATTPVTGSGAPGTVVTVTSSASSQPVCVATVNAAAFWTCPKAVLPTGGQTLTTEQNGIISSRPALIQVGTQPPAASRIDDTDHAIGYRGFTYQRGRGLGDLGDDLHFATTDGSTATFRFLGTGVRVRGELYSDQGDLGISIDGGPQQRVDTRSTDGQRHSNTALFGVTGLTLGAHDITVTKLTGTYATLDGFDILNNATRLDNSDPAILYRGFIRQGGRGLGDYQDDLHFATADGSTSALSFTGTGVQVFGEQYIDQGDLGISIDGGARQVVHTVPADGRRHAAATVFAVTGLVAGDHTITVTKLSGGYATLDGFAVLTG